MSSSEENKNVLVAHCSATQMSFRPRPVTQLWAHRFALDFQQEQQAYGYARCSVAAAAESNIKERSTHLELRDDHAEYVVKDAAEHSCFLPLRK